MTNSQLWKELDEFENTNPSHLAFRALMALVEIWPIDEQQKAIEHADKILCSWPDETRQATWSMGKAALLGNPSPAWGLIRTLALDSESLSKERLDIVKIANRANLEEITVLNLLGYSKFLELSLLYHRPEWFPSLKSLSASDSTRDTTVKAIRQSPPVSYTHLRAPRD